MGDSRNLKAKSSAHRGTTDVSYNAVRNPQPPLPPLYTEMGSESTSPAGRPSERASRAPRCSNCVAAPNS